MKELRMDVRESWARIEAWAGENAPTLHKSWRPPAKDGAIEKLQGKLGKSLPADFAESLRVHDGQKADAEDGLFPFADEVLGAMPAFRLLPLAEISREWTMMKKLHDRGEFDGRQTKPGRGVRRDWWATGWIPIADDGGGDYFCVDLAPGKGRTAGQVIVFLHDMDERPLVAKSYAAWLERLAKGLAAGKYILDEGEGVVER
jgi:cell wall assembly regulator SMI1